VFGQAPGREGWWDGWELPRNTSLPTHARGVTGAARGCEGNWGKKCQFYKRRGGEMALGSLADGTREGR